MRLAEKIKLTRRLRRIGGQVAGIERMVEQDKPCLEVIQQVIAARNALSAVGTEVLYGGVCAAAPSPQTKQMLAKLLKLV